MGQKNRLSYLKKRNEKIRDWVRFYAEHDIKVTSESYFMNTIIMHVNNDFTPSDIEDIVSRWPGMESPSYVGKRVYGKPIDDAAIIATDVETAEIEGGIEITGKLTGYGRKYLNKKENCYG